jgi:hypothetical protein
MAIEALAWLAREPERLQRFVALSGLGPDNLRDAAATPGFLAAILDYLASNENLLIAFARESGHKPDAVARAIEALGALTGPES